MKTYTMNRVEQTRPDSFNGYTEQISALEVKRRIRAAEAVVRTHDFKTQRFSIYREALINLKLYKQLLQIGG